MRIEITYTIAGEEFDVTVDIPNDELPIDWKNLSADERDDWTWNWIWENTLYSYRRL